MSNIADALDPSTKRLSDRHNWAPSRFFDDPKVVQLCYAMERGDVPEVEKLVDEGADINARGKRGITPLMWWSYPLLQVKLSDIRWKYSEKAVGSRFITGLSAGDYSAWKRESLQVLDSFKGELKKWLDLGANPRLALSDIVSPPCGGGSYWFSRGSSVCDLAAWNPVGREGTKEFTAFPILLDYMEDVDRPIPIEYGESGQYDDPHITVIFYVVNRVEYTCVAGPAIPENLALLIEAGANIEYEAPNGWTPLIAAAKGHNYNMVYMLLCAGANRRHESSDGATLRSCLAESAEFYTGRNPDLVKARLQSLAKAEAVSENGKVEPDDWKTVSLERSDLLERSRLSEVRWFVNVVDWLRVHEPSSGELEELESKVKAAYLEKLQIAIEDVECDPFAKEWGDNRWQQSSFTASGTGQPE